MRFTAFDINLTFRYAFIRHGGVFQTDLSLQSRLSLPCLTEEIRFFGLRNCTVDDRGLTKPSRYLS